MYVDPAQSGDFEAVMEGLGQAILCSGFFGLLIAAFMIFLWWRILDKAGYSGWLALLNIIPFGTFVLMLILAFGDWPALRRAAPPLAPGMPAPGGPGGPGAGMQYRQPAPPAPGGAPTYPPPPSAPPAQPGATPPPPAQGSYAPPETPAAAPPAAPAEPSAEPPAAPPAEPSAISDSVLSDSEGGEAQPKPEGDAEDTS